MKKILSLSIVLALAGCSKSEFEAPKTTDLPKGVTLVEQVLPKEGSTVIPYQKYTLDNGLTVILSPDHSDPLVHVDVTYHVGSAREEIGKSGFAHFFEHMMFQGSENVGDQQHFKIITEAGGTLNGTTNRDRTNYFETVPANQLEKMLWLESDRMGFLIDAVSQKKFEIQRSTVKNERGQNYDNRPYGLIYEKMGEALFPQGHPYSWQTIGYVEDLDRVDVNDLKAFFLRWYGPNNAVITIGGDLDSKQTLEWVNKYFGSIPRGPEVENAPKQPVTLKENRYITLEDRIQQPMVMIGWPTTYRGEETEASLDMLATLLGDGKTSLLYQELVKTGKVVDAGAFHDCAELSCTMYVYAMTDSGKNNDLSTAYKEVMDVLEKFDKEGVSKADLEEVQGSAEAGAIFGLQSVSGKVSQLASNETFYGNPNQLEKQLAELKAVTPEKVSQAFDTYMANKYKVTLSVVPKGKTQLEVQKPNFVTPNRDLPEYKKIDENSLDVRRAVDDFDRSIMPQPSKGVTAKAPDIYRANLSNGIEVLGTEAIETPTIQLQIAIPAGNRYVPKGKEGLASLTAAMMEEGTTISSSEELQKKLDKLGSSVSFNSGSYTTTISVASLTKNIDQTLAIVNEMLFDPAFEQADFDRLQKQAVEGLVYEHQRPSWLASQATREILFKGTIFDRSPDGSLVSVQALTLDDVKAFYKQTYTPIGTQIVSVGDINKSDLINKLAFLSDWKGATPEILAPQRLPTLNEQKIYLVNKPNAPQSVVRFVRQGMPFDATGELYQTQLANFNLGGNFNSRINQNLREDKGYTYGAGGYLMGNKEIGMSIFYAQVRADVTVESIKEFISEMEKFKKDGMTVDELNFMRLAVGQQDALKYETPGQKARLLGKILTYSLDDDFIDEQNELIETLGRDKLNSLAAKWFDPAQYQIVVVGDEKELLPKLKSLGIPVEVMTVKK
ncbi:M16 family metallopeptidase [Aliivibrio fischeri]|uniref:M16 family metallopeptidase n=1 Tax=Aliivibrio fischeri TaxID=668 RepID=UPI001F307AF4|nr:pitrilysin family protein [Aliivibrio fischeri]MCE7556305.1 insulinase family protein [Aliivibrio fischeri]MCE7563890.1 insulinase family protein [Aliivibrio fischeri]MCE7571240.1 insulinase family protein [Aliivibrio fischeri]